MMRLLKRIGIAALAFVLLVARPGVSLADGGTTLVVSESGVALHELEMGPSGRFTLRWTHSVEREAWEETFEITAEGAIEIVATRFKTYGAGVPSEGSATTRIEDGWVVMEGIDRNVDPLAVLATPRQDYRLFWPGGEIALTADGKPHLLTFAVKNKSSANGKPSGESR